MKVAAEPVPDKLYYRIGEVARLTGIKSHVLRYWEAEFNLPPKMRKAGQRLYRRGDIELILEIKRLLYNERYSIEGAKKKLKGILRGEGREEDTSRLLREVKEELIYLEGLLEEPQRREDSQD